MNQKFSAAMGDVTITAEREGRVEFTMPYTPSGASLLVLEENDSKPIEWIFVKPLTNDLWFATVGFFYTGFVVWMIQRPRNPEYQGSSVRQLSTASYFAFYFAFSTLTFSHGLFVPDAPKKLVFMMCRMEAVLAVPVKNQVHFRLSLTRRLHLNKLSKKLEMMRFRVPNRCREVLVMKGLIQSRMACTMAPCLHIMFRWSRTLADMSAWLCTESL